MPRHVDRSARALDRKGVRRDRGPALAVAIVLTGIAASVAAAGLMVYGVKTIGGASSETADAATDVNGQPVLHASHAVLADGAVSSIHLYVGVDRDVLDLAALEVRVDRLGEGASFASDRFQVTAQRDADGSVSSDAPTLGRGDLIELVLPVADVGLVLEPGDVFTVHWAGSAEAAPSLEGRVPPGAGGTILPLALG